MIVNPPVRKDGRCAGCGGSREKKRAHLREHTNGSRVEASFWQAAVERDPFCSRECCEHFHGAPSARTRECLHCAATFTIPVSGRGQDRRYCSKLCATRSAQKRKRSRRFDGREEPVAGHCVECGVPHAEQTPACNSCWARSYRRERLRDADTRARDNAGRIERQRRARARSGEDSVAA